MMAQDFNALPYTRFGLGQIEEDINPAFIGCGGSYVSNAYIGTFGIGYSRLNTATTPRVFNYGNPATYSSLDKFRPVFNVEVGSKFSSLQTETNSLNKNVSGLRSFGLALPIGKKTGLGFGLTPFSTTGYDISTNVGDTITYNYQGSGSINKAFLGLGQQIINRGDSVLLSVGANANFLFGTLDRQRSVIFSDASYLNSRVEDFNFVRGITYNVGLHYYEKINQRFKWQFGTRLDLARDVKGLQDFYAFTYENGIGNAIAPQDTVASFVDSEGYFRIPAGVTVGATFTIDDKISFTGQHSIMSWQDYKESFNGVEDEVTELTQRTKTSFGVMYAPLGSDPITNKSSFERATYSIGGHFGKSMYSLENTHLLQRGITFGIMLPVGYSSALNIAGEFGQLGTTDNGLIKENYFKLNIGFSLGSSKYDEWFKKRLYN